MSDTGVAKSKWYRFDETLGIKRGDLVVAVASMIFGAIAGWAVSQIFEDPKKLEFWTITAISVIAFVTCFVVLSFLTAFQREGRERLDVISESLETVERTVTQSIDQFAVLIPRESIYPEMARCIREANEQVVVITYFMYDWDNDTRTFEPAVTGNVPGIDEFYDAIYGAITRENMQYIRVWQVPDEHVHEARQKIIADPRLAKELELIESISPDRPDLCRVKICPQATTASLILVDRTTLFFNVDLFDSERGTWLSPFMLMIRDAKGRAFTDLKRVIGKLTS